MNVNFLPSNFHSANLFLYQFYLHFVLRFWNQVFTWASVIFKFFAKVALSVDAKYFCLWNLFSSSQIWSRENEVLGFFLFGGVRFWYGWPILRPATAANAKGPEMKYKYRVITDELSILISNKIQQIFITIYLIILIMQKLS